MRRSVAVAAALTIVACTPSDTSVAADVQRYLAQVQTWAAAEAEAARVIERILATQFVDEAEVRRQIADARPRITAHAARAREYLPRTSTVERIHARYVAAWEELLEAFENIERGFDSGDYTLLARGREGMARWKEGVLIVARDVRRLVEKYDIETSPAMRS